MSSTLVKTPRNRWESDADQQHLNGILDFCAQDGVRIMENSSWDKDFTWLQDYTIFDHVPLTKYERLVGLEGLEVAINDCVEESRFRVDTIVAAAEAVSSESIERETRVLKSLCETCGFVRMAELTRVVEEVANVRSARDTLPLVFELRRILDLSLAELEAFAEDLGAQIRPHLSRTR